tara:strand:- start:798 stop:1037 length:240 start_codon:yes stop_codon:yes gene_type:complete
MTLSLTERMLHAGVYADVEMVIIADIECRRIAIFAPWLSGTDTLGIGVHPNTEEATAEALVDCPALWALLWPLPAIPEA